MTKEKILNLKYQKRTCSRSQEAQQEIAVDDPTIATMPQAPVELLPMLEEG